MNQRHQKDLFYSILTLVAIAILAILIYGAVREYRPKRILQASSSIAARADSLRADSLSKLQKIPLHPYARDLCYVKGVVNGQACKLLFTTGGGETILSPQLLGLDSAAQPVDSVKGISIRNQKLSYGLQQQVQMVLGEVMLPRQDVLVKDIMKTLPEGSEKVDGIISTKAFSGHIFTVDLRANTIIIEPQENIRKIRASAPSSDVKYLRGYNGKGLSVLASMVTPFGEFWFELDNGRKHNILNNVISEKIAASQQAKFERYDMKEYTVATLPIENLCSTFTEIKVKVERATTADGVLGSSFFQQWLITFDLAQDKLYYRTKFKNDCM